MTSLVRMAIPLLVLFSLTACGGSSGSGTAQIPSVSLTGTVTDTTQASVAGVQVAVSNAATGGSVASTTTDAVGRYSLRGLPRGTALRVEFSAMQGYFPMSALVTLASDSAALLDISLPSTRDKATKMIQSVPIDNFGGTVVSPNVIGSAETASLVVPADSLLDTAGAVYPGTASIYLAPLEVGKLGTGFAPYQQAFIAAVDDRYPSDFPSMVLELYAAAAVEMVAADGSPLKSDGTDMTTLTMPVPVAPAHLRTSAASQIAPILWRYEPATSSWIEMAATPTYNGTLFQFEAEIGISGLYAVGVASSATPINGRLLYSDGSTPAAGVAVYVTGTDAAYQQMTYSDSGGNFSALVKDSGQARFDFLSWGYGLELSGSDTPGVDLTGITGAAALGDLTLDYAKPVKGVPSPAVVQVDELDVDAPYHRGIILSSGRFFSVTTSGGATDTLANLEIADVVLVAESSDPVFGQALVLAGGFSGVGVRSQVRLAGSVAYENRVRLDDLDLSAGPVLIEVLTGDGHQAFMSVNEISSNVIGPKIWTLSLSSIFSL